MPLVNGIDHPMTHQRFTDSTFQNFNHVPHALSPKQSKTHDMSTENIKCTHFETSRFDTCNLSQCFPNTPKRHPSCPQMFSRSLRIPPKRPPRHPIHYRINKNETNNKNSILLSRAYVLHSHPKFLNSDVQ